jgi:hypothetical protein
MTDRTLTRLAIAGWLMTIAITVAGLAILAITRAPALPNRYGLGHGAVGAFSVYGVVFATVGLTIVVRRSRHLVGWLLVGDGAIASIFVVMVSISFAAAAEPANLLDLARWTGWIAWAAAATGSIALAWIAFVFPDGRLSSWRFARLFWRLIAPLSLITVLYQLFQPGPMLLISSLDNPMGFAMKLYDISDPGAIAGLSVLGAMFVLVTAFALIARFRQSGTVERQQLKWFVAGASVAVVALVVVNLLALVTDLHGGNPWTLVILALASTTVPIAIGIAVLRYRLYEIDRIISRTISYGLITASLVSVYGVAVLLLQTPLGAFTGGETVAVAASTLVAAALFQPLRRRIQMAVDRRFNRSRYDTQRTVEAFAARLRDEVDLARLRVALVDSVEEAVRPVSATVWLRAGSEGRR